MELSLPADHYLRPSPSQRPRGPREFYITPQNCFLVTLLLSGNTHFPEDSVNEGKKDSRSMDFAELEILEK